LLLFTYLGVACLALSPWLLVGQRGWRSLITLVQNDAKKALLRASANGFAAVDGEPGSAWASHH